VNFSHILKFRILGRDNSSRAYEHPPIRRQIRHMITVMTTRPHLRNNEFQIDMETSPLTMIAAWRLHKLMHHPSIYPLPDMAQHAPNRTPR
jgi:hypothetical protein